MPGVAAFPRYRFQLELREYDYEVSVFCRVTFAALAACLIMTGSAQAQSRGGGSGRMGGASVVIRPAPGSLHHGGFCCGAFPGHLRGHSHLPPFAPVLFPFPFSDFDSYAEPTVVQAPPPEVVIIREPEERPAPRAASMQPAPDPQVTEVPPAGRNQLQAATRAMPKPPAIFLLTDGRQIKAQRYTISDRFVYVTEASRSTLKIPLEDVDVEATLALNRQQGIELQIPTAANEFFLSF